MTATCINNDKDTKNDNTKKVIEGPRKNVGSPNQLNKGGIFDTTSGQMK